MYSVLNRKLKVLFLHLNSKSQLQNFLSSLFEPLKNPWNYVFRDLISQTLSFSFQIPLQN